MSKTVAAAKARFEAFLKATHQEERDWIAFCEFEREVVEVAECAAMSNRYSDTDTHTRETDDMQPAVWEMMLRILPRIGLGGVVTASSGLGFAIRYGVIQPAPHALDHIADADAFNDLLGKGYEAEDAHRTQREGHAPGAERARRPHRKTRPVRQT